MNDDQFFLANAYLDGELTDDERALAEADPAVMAEVEQLRALQRLVRDVGPPAATARSAAIAAAMSEFTTSAPGDAPAAVPFRPRPSYARYLAVAAGVLGVGLFGVAIANLGGGGDDGSTDLAVFDAAEEPAEERADDTAEMRLTEAADSMVDIAGAESAPAIASAEPGDEPAEEPAEEPSAEPGYDGGEAAEAPPTGVERPDLVPDQLLTTPAEVGSFGTGLLEQLRSGGLTTPNYACPIEDVLGRAEYLDPLDGVIEILVAVDEPAGLVLGYRDDTCDLVVVGPVFDD